MARQSALRLFILWAGVIGLGNSSSVTTSYSPPPLTGPPQTAPAATADQTAPAPMAMTNQNTDKVMTTPPINQDPCSYSVEIIDFGLQIQLKNSPGGNFLVNVSEKNHPNINVVEQTFSEQSHDIIGLKPCTEYHITLQRDRGVVCTNQKNKTVATRKTNDMKEKDISYATNSIGILSYTTHWNISCADVTAKNISAKPCDSGQQTCCIKVTSDDICTDFTTTFNQPTCPTLKHTVHLSADKFLNLTNLTPEVTYPNGFPNGHPPTINLTLPKNCDLSIDYTCVEIKSNMAKVLSELEPYKDYVCMGEIKEKGTFIRNTSRVYIDAGVPDSVGKLKVNVTKNNAFIVTCPGAWIFRGPLREYRATLHLGPELVDLKTNYKCHFEFRDLKYSTTYRVEVTAFNGRYYSSPTYKTVDTLISVKTAILIFILIMIWGCLVVLCITLYVFWRWQLREDENTSVWINLKNMIHG